MAGVEQRTFPFVVDVDQLSLESPQHSLQIKSQIHYFNPWRGDRIVVCGAATHRLIKVHVVGEDFDVGVEDAGLVNNLFQDVSNPSREDEQRDAVLMQVVEEELVALPVKTSTSTHVITCFQHLNEEINFLVFRRSKFSDLSMASDSRTATASRSFLISCCTSISWALVHL